MSARRPAAASARRCLFRRRDRIAAKRSRANDHPLPLARSIQAVQYSARLDHKQTIFDRLFNHVDKERCQRQQRVILQRFPAQFPGRSNIVTRQLTDKPPGQIVVEQDLQRLSSSADSPLAESSRTPSACSLVTPSKSSRNSSKFWPAAKWSNSVFTGTLERMIQGRI